MRRLLIRSSGRQFFDCMEELLKEKEKEKEKDAMLDLLITRDFRADLLQDYAISKIYQTEGRKISVSSLSKETLDELTKNRYNEIIVLYNLSEFKGYDNVEDVAFYLKPERVTGINIEHQRKVIERGKGLTEIVQSLTKQFWIIINSLLFILVFVLHLAGSLLLEPLIILSNLSKSIKQASK